MALDFPSNPTAGQVYGNFYYDSSITSWRATGSLIPTIPAGVISEFAGSSAPAGYLMCLGQSVLVADYPALFSVIGYTYGGSGSSFTVPNMQGRVAVGRDATQTEFDTIGEVGGAKTHTLSITEMPSHTHVQNAHTHIQDAHTHRSRRGYGYTGGSNWSATDNENTSAAFSQSNESTTATNQNTVATNQNTGGGGAHNNLQPYIVINYIIKT